MTTEVTIPEATGDVRRLDELFTFDMDSIFSRDNLSDTALSAAVRTSAKFDASFMGWELYRRIIVGTGLFDRKLEDWAIGLGRQLAGAEKRNGRKLVSGVTAAKAGWIEQAARDALDHVIVGRFPASLEARSKHFNVHHSTYAKIRDVMADCMAGGLHTFRAVLHAEYFLVQWDEKRGSL